MGKKGKNGLTFLLSVSAFFLPMRPLYAAASLRSRRVEEEVEGRRRVGGWRGRVEGGWRRRLKEEVEGGWWRIGEVG